MPIYNEHMSNKYTFGRYPIKSQGGARPTLKSTNDMMTCFDRFACLTVSDSYLTPIKQFKSYCTSRTKCLGSLIF
jgi:hypothetical protein